MGLMRTIIEQKQKANIIIKVVKKKLLNIILLLKKVLNTLL